MRAPPHRRHERRRPPHRRGRRVAASSSTSRAASERDARRRATRASRAWTGPGREPSSTARSATGGRRTSSYQIDPNGQNNQTSPDGPPRPRAPPAHRPRAARRRLRAHRRRGKGASSCIASARPSSASPRAATGTERADRARPTSWARRRSRLLARRTDGRLPPAGGDRQRRLGHLGRDDREHRRHRACASSAAAPASAARRTGERAGIVFAEIGAGTGRSS